VNKPQAERPPPSSPSEGSLDRALSLVSFLRARCPWDAEQTPQTLRRYLVEETHEVVDAIDSGDPARLRDELGDLLLNLAFQIVIAEEEGHFTRDGVVSGLEEKMARRHPHLYGLGEAEPWEAIKARERGKESESGSAAGILAGFTPSADPLRHAQRLQERVAQVGFDWPDAGEALAKIREEVDEVDVELKTMEAGALEDELGDLLFSVVNVARLAGVDAPTALARANAKFVRRFSSLEGMARARGVRLEDAGLDALNLLWDEAKRGEA
jgi:MazG family protein